MHIIFDFFFDNRISYLCPVFSDISRPMIEKFELMNNYEIDEKGLESLAKTNQEYTIRELCDLQFITFCESILLKFALPSNKIITFDDDDSSDLTTTMQPQLPHDFQDTTIIIINCQGHKIFNLKRKRQLRR